MDDLLGSRDAVTVAPRPAPPRAALTDSPGPSLARAVGTVIDADVVADLPDDALAEVVAACERLQSWAAGIQARVVAERAGRESNPLAHDSLVGQVAAELSVTQGEASRVVVRAEAGADHPSVITALTAGRIDVKKAHTLLRSASQLTTAERAEAIRLYLPHAPRRTWLWLRTKLLAFAKARHGADREARDAAEHRAVHLDRAENDMAWLSAYLPSVDAASVWNVVDDMARQLRRTSDDERDLGQLRADCLAGIVTGRLLPPDRFTDADTTASPAESDGPEHAAAPVCTCGGRAPVQVVQQVVQPVRVTPTRAVVQVTIPSSALLGLDDAPGHLDGYGPVPAATARLIAQDATWRRLVTDPVTGILTDYSTTTYQPGKTLRNAIGARDETCTFPGCDVPAEWCDLDHIHPFDHDRPPGPDQRGQTNALNLHPLCRRHHVLKTHAGWAVARDPRTGITTWTAPNGATAQRPPTVLDTHVELDQVDPDTSDDLTLRALIGRGLPRSYRPAGSVHAGSPTAHHDGAPPF